MKKGYVLMNSDAPLAIDLEVTVPRIVLSTNWQNSGPMEVLLATGQQSASSENEDMEEVRLFPAEIQQATLPLQRREQQQVIMGEASARMTHDLRFRLFRITVPALASSQSFLLQVLRRYKKYISERQRKSTGIKEDKRLPEQLYVTDASAFSIAFRHLDGTAKTTNTSTLIPGLNQVVIYLDNEGTPVSYSIDGAES